MTLRAVWLVSGSGLRRRGSHTGGSEAPDNVEPDKVVALETAMGAGTGGGSAEPAAERERVAGALPTAPPRAPAKYPRWSRRALPATLRWACSGSRPSAKESSRAWHCRRRPERRRNRRRFRSGRSAVLGKRFAQHRLDLRRERGVQALRRHGVLAHDAVEQRGQIVRRERLFAGQDFVRP